MGENRIGMISINNRNSGRRWICQCQCGDYEARSGKAIHSAVAGIVDTDTIGYRCFYCAQWQIAKGRYKKKGSRDLSNFINPQNKVIEPRKPEDIIADKIATHVECDSAKIAIEVIAALNSSGYRVVREKIPQQITETKVEA